MGKIHDLTNKTFGKLLVLQRAENDKQGQPMWLCKCECGNYTKVRGYELRKLRTKSCGCGQGKTHGLYAHRLNTIWGNMKQRCFNSSNINYKNYGGRGITVCEEWKDNFVSFYDWAIKNGYKEDLTVDRIDNNGNYCPENCRWVSMEEQGNNKRCNKIVTTSLGTMTVKQLSKISGISYPTLITRYNLGIRDGRILFEGNYSSEKRKKRVIQYSKDGKFLKEYGSVVEASKQNDLDRANISSCCRGKAKSCGGYIWKYV